MVAGNIADLGFAIQTAKGTPSASAIERSYLMGGGVDPVDTINDVEESSSTRLRTISYKGRVEISGSPQMAVRPNMIGLLLYGAMGAKAVSGASDPFTHTFTLAATQPYLTIFRMLGGVLFERFSDCKIAALNFESTAGGVLAVTAEIVGATPAFKTTQDTVIAAEATEPFLHTDGKGQFVWEGSPISRVSAMRINIGTGVQGTQGDSLLSDAIEEGMQEITVETEQIITDWQLWNRFHYGSASPADNAAATPTVVTLGAPGISIIYSKRQANGTDATPARSLQFTATNVQIANIEPTEPNTNGDPLARTVSYKIYQPASGSGLTAVLKNSRATYTAN